jgi:hypothetical protein
MKLSGEQLVFFVNWPKTAIDRLSKHLLAYNILIFGYPIYAIGNSAQLPGFENGLVKFRRLFKHA